MDSLISHPWPLPRWDSKSKPVLVADGVLHSVPRLVEPVAAQHAYVVGLTDRWVSHLVRNLSTAALHFYEMRVTDLAPLSQVSGLRHLAIRWNTKVTSLEFLEAFSALETLVMEDTPKVTDLTPIAGLQNLRALEFSGGVWNKNRAHSLDPLAEVESLEELRLMNLKVEAGGLRPLSACKALRSLMVSNQFPTEDYAFLSARMPEVECSMFAPFVPLKSPIEGKDVMVVGRRKPLLNSSLDAERLARFEKRFRDLQAQFRLA